MEHKDISDLVSSVRWQYAKTMGWCPHEYTVFDWKPDLEPRFREFARHIKEFGGWEPFIKGRKTWYFHFGPYKYWLMSEPWQCTLINRTFSDFSVYKRLIDIVKHPAFKYVKGMSLQSILDAYGAKAQDGGEDAPDQTNGGQDD